MTTTTRTTTVSTPLPLPYTIFFLTLEPLLALSGAYLSHFSPTTYLTLTHAASAPFVASLPPATTVALSQLANMYMFFALNEALVLRCTGDKTVWRTLITAMLIADVGHLWSLVPLTAIEGWAGEEMGGKGWGMYWKLWEWNSMDWGNVGIVYVGMAFRIFFLLGIGMGGKRSMKAKK